MKKTRFEQIKEMNIEQMKQFLCRLTEATLELADISYVCDYCPAQKFCKLGHNGFEDWLLEEYEIK